jgi:hypothetical protein
VSLDGKEPSPAGSARAAADLNRSRSRRSQPLPLPVAVLGGAGLAPFVIGALITVAEPQAGGLPWAQIVVVYGAVILSFLGGIAWGLASAAAAQNPRLQVRTGLFTVSVVPALVGWVACFLPRPLGLLILAVSFVAMVLLDRHVAAEGLVPAWWMRLRSILSAIAATVLFMLAVFLAAGTSVGDV